MEILTTLERQIEKNRRAVEENPRDVEALLAYAQGCLRRDLRLEALQIYQRVLAITPNAAAYVALAKLFYLQLHYAESYEELRKLFALDPVNVLGHVLLHLLNDKEEAPEDLRPRLSFVPSRDSLAHQQLKLENERDIMLREVLEYQTLVAGQSDPEPIMLYYLEEAKKRVERVRGFIQKCVEWDRLAVNISPVSAAKEAKPSDAALAKAKDAVESKAENMAIPAPQVKAPSIAPQIKSKDTVESKDKATKDVREAAVAVESKDSRAIPAPSPKAQEKVILAGKDSGESTHSQTVKATKAAVVAGPSVKEQKDGKASVVAPKVAAPAAQPPKDNATKVAVSPKAEEPKVKPAAKPAAPAVAEKPAEQPLKPIAPALIPKLEVCLERLLKTRGVRKAMIIGRDSTLITKQGDFERLMELIIGVVQGMQSLVGYSESLNHWTLECKGGIIMVHTIGSDYYLILDCDPGNVGALRHSAEKGKSELCDLLQV